MKYSFYNLMLLSIIPKQNIRDFRTESYIALVEIVMLIIMLPLVKYFAGFVNFHSALIRYEVYV